MIKARLQSILNDEDGTIYLIRRLLAENARAYVRQYILAFICMGLVAASTAGSAYIMKDVINQVFVKRDGAMIYTIAGVVLLIYAVKGFSTYFQVVIMSRIGNSIVAKCQQRLFSHVLHQDQAFFDHANFGDLVARTSGTAGSARGVIDLIVTSLGRDILSLIGLVSVMVIQDPLLSLIALCIMPPAIWGVSKLVRKVKRQAKSQFVAGTKIMSAIKETIVGIRVVKAFGVEGRMEHLVHSTISEVEARANKIAGITARTSPLMESLGGVAVALVIVYGGFSVVSLGRDPGAFFSFITALLLAYDPAKRLARLNVNLSNSLVSVRLMYELLDTHPGFTDKEGAPDLKITAGEVRFDDVEFRYDEAPALKDLTFVAPAGKVTALVGSSGAGKSTAFGLIERLYDVNAGAVSIDGQDVRDVKIHSLRSQIALVNQDTFLFDLSLRDNIAIGRPDATEEEIIQAAKDANAHEFIIEQERGYDTSAGEGGGRLSGGQRQRIAIARAMLRNAPILLLDEATSALDAESESKVQDALKRLMKGRTTLVIAHRLATVHEADVIHVFDHGRVVESGSHQSLFDADGIYRRLCELQFMNGAGDEDASDDGKPSGADVA